MRFEETPLEGAYVLEPEPHADERGFFARTFCAREFAELGLNPTVAQTSVAFNEHRGTVRGMHFQLTPVAEAKLVRCTRGALYDVIVDLREDSPTHLSHFGVELSADNGRGLYVPELFAHGYQTLMDGTEASYQLSEFYTPDAGRGLAFDDPQLGIEWPLPVSTISEKDRAWPRLEAGVV